MGASTKPRTWTHGEWDLFKKIMETLPYYNYVDNKMGKGGWKEVAAILNYHKDIKRKDKSSDACRTAWDRHVKSAKRKSYWSTIPLMGSVDGVFGKSFKDIKKMDTRTLEKAFPGVTFVDADEKKQEQQKFPFVDELTKGLSPKQKEVYNNICSEVNKDYLENDILALVFIAIKARKKLEEKGIDSTKFFSLYSGLSGVL